MKSLRNIPFLITQLSTRFEKEFDAAFKDVCSRGAFILQKDLAEFEEALSNFLKVKHVLGVADGTNAMFIGLKALDIEPDDDYNFFTYLCGNCGRDTLSWCYTRFCRY